MGQRRALVALVAAVFAVLLAGSGSGAAEVLEESEVGIDLPRALRFDVAATRAAAVLPDPRTAVRVYADAGGESFASLLAALEKATGKSPLRRSLREGDEIVESAHFTLAHAGEPWRATHWVTLEERTLWPLEPGSKQGPGRLAVRVYRKSWEATGK